MGESKGLFNIIILDNINDMILREFVDDWNKVYDDILTVESIDYLFGIDIPNHSFYVPVETYINNAKKCFMIRMYNKYADIVGHPRLYAPTANIAIIDSLIDKESLTIVPVSVYAFQSDVCQSKKTRMKISPSIIVTRTSETGSSSSSHRANQQINRNK